MPPKSLQSSQSSMSQLSQSTLQFGSSKPTATATKAKKALVAGPKRTSSRLQPIPTIDIESSEDEAAFDDIELSKSDSEPREDIESAEEPPKVAAAARPPPTASKSTAKTRKSKTATVSEPASTTLNTSAKDEKVPKKDGTNVSVAALSISGPHLNVKDPAYNKLYSETKAKMGFSPPIHATGQNRINEILRVFDLSYDYGPCIGMTRLERWERAKSLGLNPPKEIYDILTTQEGIAQSTYSQDVLSGEV